MSNAFDVEAYKAKQRDESRQYAAKTFGVPLDDVAGYHGGICYSTCWVRSKKAAKKVAKAVKGETVNGGFLHGCPLGDISEQPWHDGTTVFRVTC